MDFSKAFETLVFAGKAVTASHGEGAVVCAEDWTAPLFDNAMEFVKECVVVTGTHIEVVGWIECVLLSYCVRRNVVVW